MLKLLLTILIIGALAYCGATVKLGNYTFFGHVRRIWHTEEVQELKHGVEDKAGPTVDKLERGGRAAIKAMKDDGSAGSAAPQPATP